MARTPQRLNLVRSVLTAQSLPSCLSVFQSALSLRIQSNVARDVDDVQQIQVHWFPS